MATTTSNGDNREVAVMSDSKFESIAYSEDDKLGPLGAKPPALTDPVELRAALLAAFAAAVKDASLAATGASADASVHQARKALRRCRAILALVCGSLPKRDRRDIDRALKEARRTLSVSRDHAVAPDTLTQLTLGDEDRRTSDRVLATAAEARQADAEVRQLLAEVATRAAAQYEALAAALPTELAWSVVLNGLAGTYGDARSAHGSAKRSKSWFHTWRRRTKELVNQLAVISVHAGPRIEAIRDELVGVSDTLGPGVDLIMVRDYVVTYAQGVSEDEVEDLRGAIDARLDDLMKDTRKAARDSFAQKPSKFAKRLAKAAKRDLTPADDAHLEDGDADD